MPARSSRTSRVGLVALTLMFALAAEARETERLMLSGTGFGDAVDWEFRVTEGRRSEEEWTTIPVPSQWEQHGFGAYDYGHDERKSREQGLYRHRFEVPETWRGRAIDLVFDGVMTDAEVLLNGESAGPVHQGGFYRFRYDVSPLIRPGEDNLLEVTVSKRSADRSVELAERDADYWVFGGIYRPVYLEARPPESIDHVAIQARHDGRFVLEARLRGLRDRARLSARVETLTGEPFGERIVAPLEPGQTSVELGASFDAPIPWSAESPRLYRLVVELERDGEVLHRHRERFGFRTIEIRTDGLFVNGHRVLLKGVDRHAFWPASGRTLNAEIDRRDAELIKSMNVNAVRTSHYPPDVSFLEACDELGLYVIDELAGWHDAYRTRIGRRLVREMVERDVNHPSVIFWANGNEGGWNAALDDEFGRYDVQQRPVLHPDEPLSGIDTTHYLTWAELDERLDPSSWLNRWRALFGDLPLVMPTEVLHGLYDGGSGAALADYWRRLSEAPRGAGLFLWALFDESVERTDRGGALDSDGNHAPDGVLGPYRELSGNYYAVREIFSPIQIAEERWDGAVTVANRFSETDLSACRFDWALLELPDVEQAEGAVVLEQGWMPGPGVPPGESGELRLPETVGWRGADAVSLSALDPFGRELWTWVLPAAELRAAPVTAESGEGSVLPTVEGDRLRLAAGSTRAELDLASGRLLTLAHSRGRIPLGPGPWPVGGTAVEDATRREVRHHDAGRYHEVVARDPTGGLGWTWRLYPSGWLRLELEQTVDTLSEVVGFRFEASRDELSALRWLGGGPARVWRNRLRGPRLGIWEKAAPSTPLTAAHEPKLEGFYADVHWAEIETPAGDLLIVLESPEVFLGVFAPVFPEDSQDAVAVVPPDGISFLHGISAIGTKFLPAAELGPHSRPRRLAGARTATVWLKPRSSL